MSNSDKFVWQPGDFKITSEEEFAKNAIMYNSKNIQKKQHSYRNVKEFLLSLDREKLIARYYKDFYKDNELALLIALKNNPDLSNPDLSVIIHDRISHFLNQITDVEPIVSNNAIIGKKYWNIEYFSDDTMSLMEGFDVFSVELPIKDLGELKSITNKSEAIDDLIFNSYSLLATNWEDVLGYKVLYLDDIYGCAAYLLHEMTWFGYDKEIYDKNKAKESAILNDAIEEYESDPSQCSSYEEVFGDFELPEKTPEEKAREDELINEMMISNYNESIRVYNLLRNQGEIGS